MERCLVSYTPSFVSFLRSLQPYTHKDTLLAVTKRRTMLFIIIFYFFLTILVSLNNEATAFTTAPQQQQQQQSSSLLPTASSFPRWSGTASSYSSPPFNQHQHQQRSTTTQLRNFFDAVGDLLQGGKLEAETKLPHEPFCGELSCSGEVRTFAVRERP